MIPFALRKPFLWLLILLVGSACTFPARLLGTYRPAPVPTAAPAPVEPTRLPTVTRAASAPLHPTGAATEAAASPAVVNTLAATGFSCAYAPRVDEVLDSSSAGDWIEWIRKLSGESPVEINGQTTRIQTRYSPAMFSGQPNARAFEWLSGQVRQWYPEDQVEEQPFIVENEGDTFTWKNLVLTLPGATRPDEIVILSAHLDSMSDDPMRLAPGAEDNGSGSAALLEAARLFRDLQFERTLKIVWFTGEEQGLLGSSAFAADLAPAQVRGVINLDMFGYDSDGDRCFEMHVGRLDASNEIGQCMVQTIDAYNLNLTYDYLTYTATSRSDHGSFWKAGIGAVEVLEDLFESDMPNGCRSSDPNPYYHTTQDVVEHIHADTGFSIVQAALATAAAMAVPLEMEP